MSLASTTRRVLILGGTGEARELASVLVEAGVSVTSSLAGRTATPRLPPGEVRVGGFGGPDLLAGWLTEHDVAAVVDATHPFAEQVSASAVAGCRRAQVALLRLERPRWSDQPGDAWNRVGDLTEAAEVVARLGRRVWLTIGRQGLAAFSNVRSCWFLIRCIEPPEPPLPPHHEVLLDRGPYSLGGELAVIDRHAIDVLVTKESGGSATEAKLEAARLRGLPVVVVERPAESDVPRVSSVADARAWALSVLARQEVRMGDLWNR